MADLGLEPHPEGGWYRRTWEHPSTDPGGRRLASAILYLLDGGGASAWHRVDAAEVWAHHRGGPLELVTGGDGQRPGRERTVRLGDGDDTPATVVAPGHWQRAVAVDGWALVSCVVVPEFRFEGFELLDGG